MTKSVILKPFSCSLKAKSSLLNSETFSLKRKRFPYKHETSLLKHESSILKAESFLLKGESSLLKSESYSLNCESYSLRSYLEIPSKAPKGRNAIACGNATGDKPSSLSQALKGRNMYVALTGLIYLSVSVTQGVALGYYIAPLRGFNE
jgi:hypothetical protein